MPSTVWYTMRHPSGEWQVILLGPAGLTVTEVLLDKEGTGEGREWEAEREVEREAERKRRRRE